MNTLNSTHACPWTPLDMLCPGVDAVGCWLSAWTFDYIRRSSQSIEGQSPLSCLHVLSLCTTHRRARLVPFCLKYQILATIIRSMVRSILLASLPACPASCLTSRFIGDIVSLQSSNLEGAPGLLFLGDQQLSGAPAPSPPTPLPGSPPPSQTYYPPPALEEPNIMGGLRLPPLSSRPVISAPTPNTAKGFLDNLDRFIRTLNQELDHSPRYAQLHIQYSLRLHVNMHPSEPRSYALSSETTSQRTPTMVPSSSASKRR